MEKRGCFSSRKAASPLAVLIEVVGAVAVLLVFGNIAHAAATGDDVKRIFLARDLALMVDTMQSLYGNAATDYVTTSFTSQNRLFIDFEKVSVIPGFGDPLQTFFIKDLRKNVDSYETELLLEKQTTLQLGKEGDSIKSGKTVSIDTRIVSCPNVKASQEDVSDVAVIADDEVRQITSVLLRGFRSVGSLDDAKDSKTIIQVRKGDAGKTTINLPFRSSKLAESRRLACLIGNNLLKKDVNAQLLITPSEINVQDKIILVIDADPDPRNLGSLADAIRTGTNQYPN